MNPALSLVTGPHSCQIHFTVVLPHSFQHANAHKCLPPVANLSDYVILFILLLP